MIAYSRASEMKVKEEEEEEEKKGGEEEEEEAALNYTPITNCRS